MMAVLVEEESYQSCLNVREHLLALFFHERADMGDPSECLMVGERACSRLARPQEGGANMIGMDVDTSSLKRQIVLR